MIIETSTYEDIKRHFRRYEQTIEDRMINHLAGHAGRALRKGQVKRWPVLLFTRLQYDHNTYYVAMRYNNRNAAKDNKPFIGTYVEYEGKGGKCLACNIKNGLYNERRGVSIVSSHAIKRIRERLHWEDLDWYTLVQRIIVMLDECVPCREMRKDDSTAYYTCSFGEFSCVRVDADSVIVCTFISNSLMSDRRTLIHNRNRDWWRANLSFMQALFPNNLNGVKI